MPSAAGLTATYYPSADLTGAPIATETVPDLDYTGNPAAVGTATVWSARYTGTLTAPATGTYRFSLQAGAHVTVYIDNRRTVTFKPTFEPTQNGLIHLTAGAHDIRVVVTPYLHQPVTVEAFAVTAGLHLGWQPQENRLVRAAAEAARAADVAVVVASAPASEGWDRSTLALPADQNRLISRVAAANPHTIVVLNTASAVTMPWLSKVAGVVEVWFPGQTAGTAIAQVLFGDVNPSGKLPVTFPASDRQGPARTQAEYPGDGTNVYYREGTLIGYRWYDATHQRPLFPFGFGLSYTTFGFSGLHVSRTGHGYSVTARVTNTGSRPGAEVAQLYVGAPRAAHEPLRQLKAYGKVHLAPGQAEDRPPPARPARPRRLEPGQRVAGRPGHLPALRRGLLEEPATAHPPPHPRLTRRIGPGQLGSAGCLPRTLRRARAPLPTSESGDRRRRPGVLRRLHLRPRALHPARRPQVALPAGSRHRQDLRHRAVALQRRGVHRPASGPAL